MSGHFLRASLPFLTAGVLLQSTGVCAETFEVPTMRRQGPGRFRSSRTAGRTCGPTETE